MKHTLWGSQNHSRLQPHLGSLATCPGGNIGEGIIDALQKLVEVTNVYGIEILSTLGVEIPRLG